MHHVVYDSALIPGYLHAILASIISIFVRTSVVSQEFDVLRCHDFVVTISPEREIKTDCRYQHRLEYLRCQTDWHRFASSESRVNMSIETRFEAENMVRCHVTRQDKSHL